MAEEQANGTKPARQERPPRPGVASETRSFLNAHATEPPHFAPRAALSAAAPAPNATRAASPVATPGNQPAHRQRRLHTRACPRTHRLHLLFHGDPT